jgi:sRNA-binding carbon storage regulator CsrA
MENRAGNRLYAWDHNPDYVSIFQKEKEKRKKEEKEKKKRKSKKGEADSLLWCLHAPRAVLGLRAVLSEQINKKKRKKRKLGGNESSHKL